MKKFKVFGLYLFALVLIFSMGGCGCNVEDNCGAPNIICPSNTFLKGSCQASYAACCGENAVYNEETKSCDCVTGAVLVTKNGLQACVVCQTGYVYDKDLGQCRLCTDADNCCPEGEVFCSYKDEDDKDKNECLSPQACCEKQGKYWCEATKQCVTNEQACCSAQGLEWCPIDGVEQCASKQACCEAQEGMKWCASANENTGDCIPVIDTCEGECDEGQEWCVIDGEYQCATKEQCCEDEDGKQWCTINNVDQCATVQACCEAAGKYWCDGQCQDGPCTVEKVYCDAANTVEAPENNPANCCPGGFAKIKINGVYGGCCARGASPVGQCCTTDLPDLGYGCCGNGDPNKGFGCCPESSIREDSERPKNSNDDECNGDIYEGCGPSDPSGCDE